MITNIVNSSEYCIMKELCNRNPILAHIRQVDRKQYYRRILNLSCFILEKEVCRQFLAAN